MAENQQVSESSGAWERRWSSEREGSDPRADESVRRWEQRAQPGTLCAPAAQHRLPGRQQKGGSSSLGLLFRRGKWQDCADAELNRGVGEEWGTSRVNSLPSLRAVVLRAIPAPAAWASPGFVSDTDQQAPPQTPQHGLSHLCSSKPSGCR